MKIVYSLDSEDETDLLIKRRFDLASNNEAVLYELKSMFRSIRKYGYYHNREYTGEQVDLVESIEGIFYNIMEEEGADSDPSSSMY